MSHTPPPLKDPNNVLTGLTDTTITADVTKIKAIHATELRTKINTEFTRRSLATYSGWTDPGLATGTRIRKAHIQELRDQLVQCKSGRGVAGSCPCDDSGCMDFTDPTLVADATRVRAIHVSDIRTKLQNLMTGCICETEHCQYCSDCGHEYNYCSHNGVACDDHQSGESCGYVLVAYNCASINTGGSNPKKQYSCSFTENYRCSHTASYTQVSYDGTVPWNLGDYTNPPGNNWVSTWSCKCNPYDKQGVHTSWCFR